MRLRQGRSRWSRWGAEWSCAGARRGTVHGRSVGLGAPRGCKTGLRVGARRSGAGGSVELRRGEAAAEGAQRVAEQGAQIGAALGPCMRLRGSATCGRAGAQRATALGRCAGPYRGATCGCAKGAVCGGGGA